MHNMQVDFMNEVKYKDNMWHCKNPSPLFLYVKPPALVKTDFLTHFATTHCSLVCTLLTKTLRTECKNNTGGQR